MTKDGAYITFVRRAKRMGIVPQGDQFSLSPKGLELLISPGFIAYVNQE
jgi:hypothetical protein